MDPDGSRENGNTDFILSSQSTDYRSMVKHYCFTWNNYNGSNICTFLLELKKHCSKYVFQEEQGESGTPHLQGYLCLKVKNRITALKKIFDTQIHWEVCRNVEDAIKYCQKEDTRVGLVYKHGFPVTVKVQEMCNLYEWQRELVNKLSVEADDRSIIWIYDPEGNNGKTSLLKYLVKTIGCIFTTGGKSSDVINLIFNNRKYMEHSENTVVIYNLPRSKVDNRTIAYNALECVKDGCISNNKFECGSFICNSPHVVVFANCMPDVQALTIDRWVVYTIRYKRLVRIGLRDRSIGDSDYESDMD